MFLKMKWSSDDILSIGIVSFTVLQRIVARSCSWSSLTFLFRLYVTRRAACFFLVVKWNVSATAVWLVISLAINGLILFLYQAENRQIILPRKCFESVPFCTSLISHSSCNVVLSSFKRLNVAEVIPVAVVAEIFVPERFLHKLLVKRLRIYSIRYTESSKSNQNYNLRLLPEGEAINV